MAEDRAILAARRARRALAEGSTRDGAWLALYAAELDPAHGLGLAVLSRILHEVSGDALATLGMREALTRPLPEPERTEVERFHRIDLWSRGLLEHVEGQAVLPVSAFDAQDDFRPTERHDPWLSDREESWGDRAKAIRALKRLVGALSDAWEMPKAGDPLRTDDAWPDMPAYREWKQSDPLSRPEPEAEAEATAPETLVLSDHWMSERIEGLERAESLAEAEGLADQWLELRPGRIAPLVAAMRIAHAQGRTESLEAHEAELLAISTEDLNELEEARVGLGLLQRFRAQLDILNRMDRLAPGHPVVLANRGAVALELDDPESAERDLGLALQLDPYSGPALTNLALLRLREEDYVSARGLLEQAKSVHPEEAQVRYYLAACLQNQQHPQEALAEVLKAIELDPSFAPAHQLLVQLGGEVSSKS